MSDTDVKLKVKAYDGSLREVGPANTEQGRSQMLEYMVKELTKLKSGEIDPEQFPYRSSAMLVLREGLRNLNGDPPKSRHVSAMYEVFDAYLDTPIVWELMGEECKQLAATYVSKRQLS